MPMRVKPSKMTTLQNSITRERPHLAPHSITLKADYGRYLLHTCQLPVFPFSKQKGVGGSFPIQITYVRARVTSLEQLSLTEFSGK